MFPMLCEEMKDLLPRAYFGGEDVPPYYHLKTDPAGSIEDLVSSVRLIGCGSQCSGYVDDEGVHFHLPDEETILVDLSKNFIFVSQPTVIEGAFPSAWQLLFFLQEPAQKALFIGADRATLVEKTEQTLRLCRALDGLWAQEAFLDVTREMAESEDAREKGLARLMKAYEEEVIGSPSEMWEFWATFGGLLMKERLGLSVEAIAQ